MGNIGGGYLFFGVGLSFLVLGMGWACMEVEVEMHGNVDGDTQDQK